MALLLVNTLHVISLQTLLPSHGVKRSAKSRRGQDNLVVSVMVLESDCMGLNPGFTT